MSDSAPATPPASRPRLPWLVGLATFALLVFIGVSRSFPPLPGELTLQLKFPSGNPPRIEPLVSAGTFGQADFLAVKYLDRTTATLSYDYWGFGGPASEPFTFRPGELHTLRITFPPFSATETTPINKPAPLRLEFDGREILKADVGFHRRAANQIFFGENPVGGTTAGAVFRGDIYTADGRELRGPPSGFFSWFSRFGFWLVTCPGEVAFFALLAVGAAFLSRWLAGRVAALRHLSTPRLVFAGHSRSPHGWFLGTVAVCALAFSYVVTGGSFRFIFPEVFGSFYDHQAVSLLHGHLDVPEAALSGEAFIFEGKYYGYFGPTPALLRMPFSAFNLAFGQLSRSFLLAYYVASLAAVYAILIHVSRLLSGRSSWPARGDVMLLVGTAGLGSTLFFVSSRAYIYHEAILCGVAFALWSSWYSLRWIAQPDGRAWLPALVLGTLSVHSRPPVGLFALSLLGSAAAFLLWQHRSAGLRAWSRPIAIGLLSVLGVLSFNGLSYLKFRNFDGAPLKYHIQYTPERLAAIEGKNFHLSNFRYNFAVYAWRPNFSLSAKFPYLRVEGRNPNEYPGTRIDLAETTLPLPYTLPAIAFLAVVGGLVALVRWPASRWPLAILALASLPMSVALFTAVAVSQRYTADFCPALLIAAAFGLTAAEHLPRGAHRAFRATASLLALCAVFVTASVTLSYQGEGVWGVPDDVKARYQSLRQAADGLFAPSPHDR